jgi:hypothetical protein
MEARTGEFHIAVERHEDDRIAALAVPPGATRLATALPFHPRHRLGIDQLLLDGSHQRLGLCDRQAEVLRPLRLFIEYRDFRGVAGGSVIGDDLQQDPHAHGEPPLLIAGKRAFHNDRSGKLEASPARWLPAILARVGTQTP